MLKAAVFREYQGLPLFLVGESLTSGERQVVEAEVHLEAARARYTDIQHAGRVGDDESERNLRKAYNDMSEAIRSALRYIG